MVALGKELSENFESAKRVFVEDLYQALDKEKQPSRHRRRWRFICRGPALGKKIIFLKILCRGLPRALDK